MANTSSFYPTQSNLNLESGASTLDPEESSVPQNIQKWVSGVSDGKPSPERSDTTDDTYIPSKKSTSFTSATDTQVNQRVGSYFKSQMDWVGHVIDIDQRNKSFNAQLHGKDESGTYEVAEFDFEEVSRDDLKLLRKGAVFYWSVGFGYEPGGQRSRKSLLKFKRSVPLETDEFDKIMDDASALAKEIAWE